MDTESKTILRDLAKQVAEIAALPIQKIRRDLWYKHNALKPEKVMMLCSPEGAWRELIPDNVLQISEHPMRQWEWSLRSTIYHHEHLHDDFAIEPVFSISYVNSRSNWGLQEEYQRVSDIGSCTWTSPIQNIDDCKKLQFRKITIDHEKTKDNLELANEIFGDILKVRQHGGFWWSLGMTQDLIKLRGLNQIMLDMYDNKELLHTIMSFLRDGLTQELDFLENNSLLSLNNEGNYVGSGGLGYTKELPSADYDGKAKCCDLWGFAESQELVGVSPAMFEEFALQYQLPLLSRFGLNCYGCCEPLHNKFNQIKKIPNLRRISISPWTNLQIAADELQDKYIFSWKPNPAYLAAVKFDAEMIKMDIKNTMEIAKDCVLEMVLKDTHTVNNDLSRFDRWTTIAQELTQNP